MYVLLCLFPDLPSKPDKVAIVTGGSRGIGVEVVKKLLQCDMEVIIGKLFAKLLSLQLLLVSL